MINSRVVTGWVIITNSGAGGTDVSVKHFGYMLWSNKAGKVTGNLGEVERVVDRGQ
jgi:hypothetical protein